MPKSSQAKSHKFSSFLTNFFTKKNMSSPSLPASNLFVVPQEKFTGRVSNQERWLTQFDYQQHLVHCREAYFNNPHARVYINRQVNMIVNDGLTLQFNPLWSHINASLDFKEQQSKQIEVQERWYLWASSLTCMLKSDMSFHVAQHELYKMLLRDGEFFVILHRQYDEHLVNPLRLQIIATDALPYDLAGDYVFDANEDIIGANASYQLLVLAQIQRILPS